MSTIGVLLAAMCVAGQSGDWSRPETWQGKAVPGPGDDVIVKDVAVTLTGPVKTVFTAETSPDWEC